MWLRLPEKGRKEMEQVPVALCILPKQKNLQKAILHQ